MFLGRRDGGANASEMAPSKSKVRLELCQLKHASHGTVEAIWECTENRSFVRDWMVADAVSDERVSGPFSLVTGKITGNSVKITPDIVL